MTRRFPDISKARGETNTSVAIGAGLGMLVGVIVLIIIGIVLATLYSVRPARARDAGQWSGADPIIQSWYKGLMWPDNPAMSCCGAADAYWADKVDVIDGKVFATITDTRDDGPLGRQHVPPGTRVEIPAHKMKWDRGNPSGHVVVFLGAGLNVLCFVMNGGV